ncbi:MAG: hypothetical protein ACOZQL_28805 [Myxococcota bacterium]
MRRSGWVVAVVVVVVVAACGDLPGRCKSDSDCSGGGRCDPELGACVSVTKDAGDDGGTDGGTGGGGSMTGGGGGTTGGGGMTGGGGGATGGGGMTGGGGGTTGGGGGSQGCTPGAECRAKNGVCDVAEICDGQGQCPADGFEPSSTACRAASAGGCDIAEFCTGASPDCPADGFAPATTVCRVATGDCDVEETCTGTSAACPLDGVKPSSQVCRQATLPCDVTENCTGSSKMCPTDSFTAGGTVCRPQNGVCDVAEVCSGTAPSCPADAFVAAGTTCRSATNSCDVAEVCSGSSGACPSNSFASASTICVQQSCSNGVVSLPRYCAGTSDTCNTSSTMGCNGYACGGSSCRTSCGAQSDCLGTHYCDASSRCAVKKNNFEICANAYECASAACTPSYVDADGDGFGTGSPTSYCGTTAPSGRSLVNTDCCDSDNRAKPGGTFQTTARTCGGYDFNCDGVEEHQEVSNNACKTTGTCNVDRECSGSTGWAGAEPGCGVTANFYATCNVMAACGGTVCSATATSRTQGCQ